MNMMITMVTDIYSSTKVKCEEQDDEYQDVECV